MIDLLLKRRIFVFVVLASLAVLLFLSGNSIAGSYYAAQVTCRDINSGFNQKSYEGYALGFISGVNLSTGRNSDLVANGTQIYPWVQRYCSNNPSDRMIDAVVALDKEIDATR